MFVLAVPRGTPIPSTSPVNTPSPQASPVMSPEMSPTPSPVPSPIPSPVPSPIPSPVAPFPPSPPLPPSSAVGCYPQTWLGKMSYPGYNETRSSVTLDECNALCHANTKCQFVRFYASGRCDLRGTPNATDGSYNATVDQLCFPRPNCESCGGTVL